MSSFTPDPSSADASDASAPNPSVPDGVCLRRATHDDIPALECLVEVSVRRIGGRHYSSRQIESSLQHLFGVDRQLIDDGTYYVAATDNGVATEGPVVGCGGWSYRQTPFGGDQAAVQDAEVRDPATDPAVLRAFFVHPDWTRRGIGQALLECCEQAARDAGFDRFELTSTLSGHALYKAAGYRDVSSISIELPGGVELDAIVMAKP
jgi:GNAT superfamily N-acetyltransferase